MNPFDKLFESQKKAAAEQAAAFSLLRNVTEWAESTTSPDIRGTFDLPADPWRSGALHHSRLGQGPIRLIGTIVYSVPMLGWYRVQLDELNTDTPCCRLLQQPGGPMAAAQDSQLQVGSPVLVELVPGYPYGIILGAVPTPVVSGARQTVDWIVQGGGGGFNRSRYYRDLLTAFAREGGLRHFGSGGPIDQLALGEWGIHTPLGVAAHVGNFMAFLRVSEACGLTLNWLDNHARLSGYNLDVRTAGSEHQTRNDAGEIQRVSGSTPFAWEACGYFQHGTRSTREVDARESQIRSNEAPLEPADGKLAPFWRYRQFGGYLGQGYRRELVIPANLESPAPNLRDETSAHPTVFLEQLTVAGDWTVASARSINLVKRTMLPVVVQLRDPEDPSGDGPDDYRAAGMFGGGEAHRVKAVEFGGENGNVAEVCGLADIQAHLFNWQGAHPFHYHKKDWKVREPSQDPKFQRLVLASALSELKKKTFIPARPAVKLTPDHRYGETPYYETTSGIHQLPQGGVVIRGAWGEEISLVGGNVLISCPGNVFLMPGRSLVAMAGDDAVVRAKKSIDLSGTEGDVRIKAKKNLEMLAGAGGAQGRILIENQAREDRHNYKDKVGEDIEGSGIILKAANSKLISWTAGVYMRTGGGGIKPGDIVLDADKGQRDIRTVSRNFFRHIQQQAADAFPQSKSKTVVNSSDAFTNRFDAQLLAKGGAYITEGGVLVRGNVTVMGGHVASEQSTTFQGLVGTIDPGTQAHRANDKALRDVEKLLSDSRKQLGDDYKDQLDKEYYEDKKIGNDEFQKDATFSWRDEKQYGTQDDFQLPEPWWQQLAGRAGVQTDAWTEEKVTCGGKELMPYPGNKKWTENTLLRYNLRLFDPASGRDKDRSSGLYEDFEPGELEKTVPQGNFKVMSPES